MTDTATHLVCQHCDAVDTIEAVRLDDMSDAEQSGGVYRCSACAAQSGIWIETAPNVDRLANA